MLNCRKLPWSWCKADETWTLHATTAGMTIIFAILNALSIFSLKTTHAILTIKSFFRISGTSNSAVAATPLRIYEIWTFRGGCSIKYISVVPSLSVNISPTFVSHLRLLGLPKCKSTVTQEEKNTLQNLNIWLRVSPECLVDISRILAKIGENVDSGGPYSFRVIQYWMRICLNVVLAEF